MIRHVDIEALRAKRDAIEQEITRHREAIAALEQKKNDLEIGDRITIEFSIDQQHDSTRRESDDQARARNFSGKKKSRGKRPKKPRDLPTIPNMILSALKDARERALPGMAPVDVTRFIRKNYWPEAPAVAVNPIVWRMWSRDRVLARDDGGLYSLPLTQPPHNPDGDSDDLLAKAEGFPSGVRH